MSGGVTKTMSKPSGKTQVSYRFKKNMKTRAVGLVCLGALLSACTSPGTMLSITEVKPWERGTLARDDMQLVNDSLEQSVDEHIYFSKEASTGGVSVKGGGCGCN